MTKQILITLLLGIPQLASAIPAGVELAAEQNSYGESMTCSYGGYMALSESDSRNHALVVQRPLEAGGYFRVVLHDTEPTVLVADLKDGNLEISTTLAVWHIDYQSKAARVSMGIKLGGRSRTLECEIQDSRLARNN